MKISNILKVAFLAIPLCLSSCHTKKQAVKDTPQTVTTQEAENNTEILNMVKSNAQPSQFITSKLKFNVEYGSQQMSLTGNLKMKRDDVIQMQLMAFGFVEAGRLEFTKDYVLIIDRINKQYLQVPYNYVDFLRNSGINFYTLQALFWNELFKPGQQSVDKIDMSDFTTSTDGNEIIINLEQGKMNYSWLTNKQSGRIHMTNISYRDTFNGNTQLNWEYGEFTKLGQKTFPSNMKITMTMPEKEIKLGIRLNYLSNDSEWETRTKVSDKYRKVDVDQILKRFMAL